MPGPVPPAGGWAPSQSAVRPPLPVCGASPDPRRDRRRVSWDSGGYSHLSGALEPLPPPGPSHPEAGVSHRRRKDASGMLLPRLVEGLAWVPVCSVRTDTPLPSWCGPRSEGHSVSPGTWGAIPSCSGSPFPGLPNGQHGHCLKQWDRELMRGSSQITAPPHTQREADQPLPPRLERGTPSTGSSQSHRCGRALLWEAGPGTLLTSPVNPSLGPPTWHRGGAGGHLRANPPYSGQIRLGVSVARLTEAPAGETPSCLSASGGDSGLQPSAQPWPTPHLCV